MSGHSTPADLVVLHAVRTLGYADTAHLAARTELSESEVDEHLLDAQARGHVAWSSFGGDGGWSMTGVGKAHGERLLATELDETSARADVIAAHRDFLPLNDLVAGACTRWQLAELALSDEPVTLEATVGALLQAAEALGVLEARLTAQLERFRGYHARFASACRCASDDPAWITGTDRASAHKVWFELHEDLIATLGLTR